MLVYGLCMFRNEVDIARLNILYHLSLGIDRILVVDNGSSDGTDHVLDRLGRETPRVRWTRDSGPYFQSRVLTRLAREAFREGADWVVQIDADEFWHVPESDFRGVLAEAKAGVLHAQVVNFVQRRSQMQPAPDALLYMTRRTASPVRPPWHAQDLVESRQIAFVEKAYPRKCISRLTAEIEIAAGNHSVSGAAGPMSRTEKVFCLHAPLRSRATLEERVRSASRADEAGRGPRQSRNRRRLASLRHGSAIDLEWAANSYHDDCLDVYGERHALIFDPCLRDALAPLISEAGAISSLDEL